MVCLRGEAAVESVVLRSTDGLVSHLPAQLVINAKQEVPPLLAGLQIRLRIPCPKTVLDSRNHD